MSTMKLTPQEILLFDNIAFSLCEEIDIFYSAIQNKEFSDAIHYESEIRTNLITFVDTLENCNEGPKFKSTLQKVYLISMGAFKLYNP